MMKIDRVRLNRIQKWLDSEPTAMAFDEMTSLLTSPEMGFRLIHSSDSHFIFYHHSCPVLVPLQNVAGEVKAYQVKAFIAAYRRCIEIMIEPLGR